MKLRFFEEVWREGGMFVAYAPELDIAACGETVEAASRNLGEVVQINFEEMRKLGTLDKFLSDAGFSLADPDQRVIELGKELIGFETREIAV
jgi:predicted RNase H-like HicB family nuclease